MKPLSADRFFDLVVIGSGPAGLALVARILESRPAALYTDDEHVHLHWLKRKEKNGQRQRGERQFLHTRWENGRKVFVNGIKEKMDGDENECVCDGVMRILVVDRLGAWMANWDRLFKAYEIPHLRSPMFFHPAPADIDALVAFAEQRATAAAAAGSAAHGRRKNGVVGKGETTTTTTPDLIEIAGCVGKEISKHKRKQGRRRAAAMGPAVNERERKDYFTPSTQLFKDFIQRDVVERYGLQNNGKPWKSANEAFSATATTESTEQTAVQLVRGEVKRLEWSNAHVDGWDTMDAFCLTLAGDEAEKDIHLAAKAVVCATGAGVTPNVPAYLASTAFSGLRPAGPGWCHSTQIGLHGRKDVLPLHAMKPCRLLSHFEFVVIGGGLTSAQLCDVAIRKDARVHVTLVVRRHLQVKPFDVGLQWVGRYANLEKMQFWQESDANERLRKLRQARNGGSVTPRYAKLLKQYEQQGRLTILTCADVEEAHWTPSEQASAHKDDGEWTLCVRQRRSEDEKGLSTTTTTTTTTKTKIRADYIVAATGAAPQLGNVPFLAPVRDPDSVPEFGGLPFITEDLRYGKDLPLFFTGAFSALQIGPGAFNLEGMRAAADRIAVRLQELAVTGSIDGNVINPEPRSPSSSSRGRSAYAHFPYALLAQEVEA